VIPNLSQNMVEAMKIVMDSDGTPRLMPLCMFHLPPLTLGASLSTLYSHAEPNPTISGPVTTSSPSDRPFHDKAENAIIIFDTSYNNPFGWHWLTFIVHRRALLAHIPAAHRTCVPLCSAPEPIPTPVNVPWSAWGPAATRWFEGERTATAWIMRTAGQRVVALEEGPEGTSTSIIVRDFNPYAVRAARALAAVSGQLQQGNWSKQLPNGNRMTRNTGWHHHRRETRCPSSAQWWKVGTSQYCGYWATWPIERLWPSSTGYHEGPCGRPEPRTSVAKFV
jgi:hypothetical protein